MILYKVIALIVHIYIKIIGCRIEGAENVPSEGPCIIAANHISNYDPFFVAIAVRKRILSFMGKESLFKAPVLGWLLGRLGAFPVSRGESDISAMRRSVATLKEGKALAIFPEGTRSATGEMNQALDGVGLIAEKSRAPVIPVRIVKHNKKRWQRHKTQVFIGEPILIDQLDIPEDKRQRRKYIAALIMERIALLGGMK